MKQPTNSSSTRKWYEEHGKVIDTDTGPWARANLVDIEAREASLIKLAEQRGYRRGKKK